MNYGNRLLFLILILSFTLLVGCSKIKNFHYDLYDNYSIKAIDNKIKLYKNDNVVDIYELDYKIKEFKYNSDVVCLKLANGDYYMIYYFDTSIYGPFDKETLDSTINADSTMTFDMDFKDILKADVVYDEK